MGGGEAKRLHTKYLFETRNGREHSKNLDVDERIKLKCGI